MTYIKADIPRPGRNAGMGLNPRSGDGIAIFDLDEVLRYPSRDDAGVVIEDDIIMKPGGYAITVYVTSGKTEFTSNSDGETDNEGFSPSLQVNHPGNNREISTIKKRILKYIDFKCITKYEYYKESKMSNGILSQVGGMSEDNLYKFLSCYKDINHTWLLMGDGEMINADKKIVVTEDDIVLPTNEKLPLNVLLEYIREKDRRIEELGAKKHELSLANRGKKFSNIDVNNYNVVEQEVDYNNISEKE